MPFIPNPEEAKKWDYKEPCRHPEHNPPGMIVLPPGLHTYQCPGCGEAHTFRVTTPMLCNKKESK